MPRGWASFARIFRQCQTDLLPDSFSELTFSDMERVRTHLNYQLGKHVLILVREGLRVVELGVNPVIYPHLNQVSHQPCFINIDKKNLQSSCRIYPCPSPKISRGKNHRCGCVLPRQLVLRSSASQVLPGTRIHSL